ncbi:MAG: hypothetical protein JEY99_01205 [Spirochaetales bacterium]|nr:hypothetical protein [Spirochaetales bacterium]
MDILSSLTTWLMVVLLQVAPVQDMNVGDTLSYKNIEYDMGIEFELTEVPAEDYWIVAGRFFTPEDRTILAEYEAAGYFDDFLNQLFYLKEGEDDSAFYHFSVNEAGFPLPLSISLGEDSELYVNGGYSMPFIDADTFEFMGGEDETYHYSDGDLDVYITSKTYSNSKASELSAITINYEMAGIHGKFFQVPGGLE